MAKVVRVRALPTGVGSDSEVSYSTSLPLQLMPVTADQERVQFAVIKPRARALHYLGFLAVLADFLNCAAVGAPAEPGFLIFSPEPASMRLRLA